MILVAGSNFELGYEICYLLASKGRAIRVLVLNSTGPTEMERLKNFGATVMQGDWQAPLFLAVCFSGVNEVICFPGRIWPGNPVERENKNMDQINVMNLIEAARDADILRFMYISFSNDLHLSFPAGKGKSSIEQGLIKSGIPYTILHVCNKKSQGDRSGRQSESKISTNNLARLVLEALENPDQRNAIVELAGSAAQTKEKNIPLHFLG